MRDIIRNPMATRPAIPMRPTRFRALVAERMAVRVLDLMEAQGLNAYRLAQRMGLQPKHITRTLRGETCMRIDTVCAFARALGVPPSSILGELDEVCADLD